MNNMNTQQQLQMIRSNPQYMGNNTVAEMFRLRDNKDHDGLVELYKNTCKTFNIQPNPQYLK